MNDSTRYGIRYTTWLLTMMVCWFSLSALAQEKVTVMLTPVQQVLPPQAGRYISDPGRFFKVWLVNNTDEQQQVHLGLQIEQRFPNQELWVSTRMENSHIPIRPIVLGPNQQKLLNAIEMRHLFDHFTKDDVFIKDGRHLNITDGDYGLLPEGEYEAFLTAYKWDPDLTSPVVLSDPSGGNALFNICYEAEAPKFLSPVVTDMDGGLGELKVVKLNKNLPISFTWIAPTLNCNAAPINFEYAVRIVELGSLMPDEAMHTNTQTFLERRNLISTTFTVSQAYTRQMIEDGQAEGKVYALQVTATTPYMNQNSINFSLIKNEGKSPILLFQLYDPDYEIPDLAERPQNDDTPDGDGDVSTMSENDETDNGHLYTFEQPLLTGPAFVGMTSRIVYIEQDIPVEWRRAWFVGGKGEMTDTIHFNYQLSLYKGNSSDTKETMFSYDPIYSVKTTSLNHVISWEDIKDKVVQGDYLMLRVTATPFDKEMDLTMLGDDKNYKDFALSSAYEETFQCGMSTATVGNKTLISSKPARNAKLYIGAWELTFDDNYEQEVKLEDGLLKGTGFIHWPVQGLEGRIAVKFDDLKVNTEGFVFDGTCKTRVNPSTSKENVTINGKSYSPSDISEIACNLFSEEVLSDIMGTAKLPAELQEKVKNEGTNLAQSYNIGQYYAAYKQAENLWTSGTIADLYFPLELPKVIKDQLPSDFNIQIADMTFTPSAAFMNIIAEIVMPNSDMFNEQQVLVFGAPHLCVQPDRILPEDGVIALLSNFPIKDPSSEFVLTFKAPTDPLNPQGQNGCYIRWKNEEFESLGLEIAMSLPNTKRIISGKTHDDIPALLNLYTTIKAKKSAVNFLAEGTLTPFEVNDLPGWKFGTSAGDEGVTVIFDHNAEDNGKNMPTAAQIDNLYSNNAFDFSLCGNGVSEANWKAWTGVYINGLSVEFPKFAVFGDGDKGVTISADSMLIDASGITCKASGKDILNAETGSCGGWAFSVSNATLDIVQNNFDNCQLDGSFGVPLLGKAAQKKAADETKKTKNIDVDGTITTSGNDDYKDIDYHCEIRHFTKMQEVNYTKWNAAGEEMETVKRRGYKNNQLAYVFSTKNADKADLTLNFVLGNMTLLGDQTYFLVESVDADPEKADDKAYTQVELCMAGDITIAGIDNVNSRLAKVAEKIGNDKLPIHMPGIHFAKMRLSNVKEEAWRTDLGLDPDNLHETRLNAQKEWLKKNWDYKFISGEEVELSPDECYFNYGEWSLASEAKKIGPFTFNIEKFKPNMDGDTFALDIEGGIGFAGERDNMITAKGGFSISGKLHKEGGIKNIKNWYLSDGDLDFNSFGLKADFSVLYLEGNFLFGTNKDDKNEKGFCCENLTVYIEGLFELTCTGGYYNHKASTLTSEEKEMLEADDAGLKNTGNSDAKDINYSWGYFTVRLETEMLRVDPIVINRISGGFYFNCKPKAAAAAEGKKSHRYSGIPTGQYGMIGIAFGLGMSTSAGKDVLNVDADMLVVYDRVSHCLSSFHFYGGVEAVGGIIKADANLVYVNDKTSAGKTINRYLCLNITAESGLSSEYVKEIAGKVNKKLESLKASFDKFSSEVEGLSTDPITALQGLKKLSGKMDKDEAENLADEDSADESVGGEGNLTEAEKQQRNDLGLQAMRTKMELELLITWVKDATSYPTPKWHLYLGQPAKEKRCSFTYIDFESKICSAHIGADGYICIGNELPDNGQLPPIPTKISDFLSGHKYSNVEMGADEAKAQQSRMSAVRAMLNPNNINGGVMVGASAWGDIDINLGLLKAGLGATAGFDASLVNYGNSAFCVNNGSSMGYKGWYATGQLYAYLWAHLGVHIDLGSLFDDDIYFFTAGIGGVLQVGLPHPSWVEGQARIKMTFLGGLFKVNKKFKFSAGDHCVPFRGNALDGFSLFSGINMGSDSLYQALCRPEFAVTKAEASKMILSTNASLGSHYRLVDPSYLADMAQEYYNKSESDIDDELRDKLSLQASRTYVFDLLSDKGVRLVDLGKTPTDLLRRNPNITEKEFYQEVGQNLNPDYTKGSPYSNLLAAIASLHYTREKTLYDGSSKMGGYELSNYLEQEAIKTNNTSRISTLLLLEAINGVTLNTFEVAGGGTTIKDGKLDKWVNTIGDRESIKELKVNLRETHGQTFHLSDMTLEKGHSYALVISGTAYEIKNGERMWCEYGYKKDDKMEWIPMKWSQEKIWFFRVKDDDEDIIDTYSLSTIEPYAALAYPSVDGTKVQNSSNEPFTAYYGDIMQPTIALNRDITKDLQQNKMKWILTAYDASEFAKKDSTECWKIVQVRNAEYQNQDNCINLHPATAFDRIRKFSNGIMNEGRAYDYTNELYHLQLAYTYKAPQRNADGTLKRWRGQSWASVLETERDTTVYLVDLWMKSAPHGVTIEGMADPQDDTWLTTTDRNATGRLLPYVVPFVGASPVEEPRLDYIFSHNDSEITFQNLKYKHRNENGKEVEVGPYRLIDPWMYFAYLSKYTFVGDRSLAKYGFDMQYIPFASESLIYDFNGSVVNSDFIKGEKSMSLSRLRDEMYDTWNTWAYNDTLQPKWPLPSTLATIGEITAANQNGKASTIAPRALNITKNDITTSYSELLRDYMAPYHVAEKLSAKLAEQARDVYYRFVNSWDGNKQQIDEEKLNGLMQTFNDQHRGQYLEEKERGVTVRVPYYQLPLIFGGTFGFKEGDPGSSYFNGKKLQHKDRGFDTSISGGIMSSDKKASKGRWSTDLANILFYRLVGDEAVKSAKGTYYSPQVFRKSTEAAYNASYDPNKPNAIPLDKFDSYLSLKEVSKFKASSYRVDAYNLETGYYEVYGRAAKPWNEYISVGYPSDTYKTLAELDDHINYSERDLETTLDKPTLCLIWTESNSTMTLIFSQHNYQVGDRFGGNTITALWRGQQCMDATKTSNLSMRSNTTSFVIDSSVKDAYIGDMNSWFFAYYRLKSISGLQYLNTQDVTDMSSLFNGCSELESLDLTSFNTGKVSNMNRMFSQCTKLKTLKQKFVTKNVTDMSFMFYQCESLTSLNLSNFNDENVVSTGAMFQRCSNLKTLNISQFSGNSVENTCDMFYGCKVLENIDVRSYVGFKIKACSNMFAGCEKLKTLHIEKFSPDEMGETDCLNMFNSVNQSLDSYVAYDLLRMIYVQIPGRRNITNHPNKIILAQNKQNQYELIFTKTSKALNMGSTYDIEGKKTVYEGMKVQMVWNYSDIQNTSSSIPWASYKSNLVRITIDPSFVPDSKTLISNSDFSGTDQIVTIKNWFAGCRNVVAIDGLNYLYLKEVEDMSLMFENCEKLETLDIGNIDMYSVRYIKDMFKGCTSLKKLRMKLDLGYVTDLSGFFKGLKSLESLEFTGVNVFGVTSMNEMFSDCENLRSLDLSDFNTIYRTSDTEESNLTDMRFMFQGCRNLESIKWGSQFYTGKVESMRNMFTLCSSLKELDLSKMDTRSVTSMREMFTSCSSLQKIDIGNWNTENVKDMTRMFHGCTSLNNLNISGFSTAKMAQCEDMFKGVPYQCTIYIPYDISTQIHPNQINKPTYPNLVIVDPAYVIEYKDGNGKSLVFLTSNTKYSTEKKSGYQNTWNGHEIIRVWSGMDVLNRKRNDAGFAGSDIKYVSVRIDPSFANVYPLSTSNWFLNIDVKSIQGLEYLNTSKVTDMRFMFSKCTLSSIDLSHFDTSKVTDMSFMFSGCKGLTSLDLSHFDTSKVTDMNFMFYGCKGLTSLDLSHFDTSNVINMMFMFQDCSNLTSIDVSNFDTSNVRDMTRMFSGCESLTSLDVSNFNTEKVSTLENMFSDCSNLKELNLKNFNMTNVEGVADLFVGCTQLRRLWVGNDFNLTKAQDRDLEINYRGPFTYVKNLSVIVPVEKYQQYRTDFVNKLRFVEGTNGWIVTEGPRAIWTEDNSTLTFTNMSPVTKVGDDFNGHKVSGIWSAEQLTNSPEYDAPAWAKTVIRSNVTVAAEGSVYGKVSTVVIDPSFKDVKPLSTSHWFHLGSQLKKINGLEYLNTENVRSMEGMFATCGLSDINDILRLNTLKVENVANMFSGCANIKSVDIPVGMKKVTNMSGMFRDCVNLDYISFTKFDFTHVTDVSDLFSGCTALKRINMNGIAWNEETLARSKNVFEGLSGVKLKINQFESHCPNLRSDFARLGFTDATGTIMFKSAMAAWNEKESTLTFLCAIDEPSGATAVWRDDDILNTPVVDGKVPWTETVQGKVTTVIFESSFSNVNPKSTAYWFADYTTSVLSRIVNIKYLATEKVTDMSGMFYNCGKLPSIDLSSFYPVRLTSMKDMFRDCKSMGILKMSNLSTEYVTDMSGLFAGCGMSRIEIPNFNTRNVTNADMMFNNITATLLVVGDDFVFPQLQTKAKDAFGGVRTDQLNVNFANKQNGQVMNDLIYKLGYGDAGGEDTRSEIQVVWTEDNQTLTFLYNKKVKQGDNYNRHVVTNVWNYSMIYYNPEDKEPDWVKALKGVVTTVEIDPTFKDAWINSTSHWFALGSQLTTINGLSNLNTQNVESMSFMFSGCGVEALDVRTLKTDQVTNMTGMFDGCTNLKSLKYLRFNTTNVVSMDRMFCDCVQLTTLDLKSFDMSNVTNISKMFANCSNLNISFKQLDLNREALHNASNYDAFSGTSHLSLRLSPSVYTTTTKQSTISSHLRKIGHTGPILFQSY